MRFVLFCHSLLSDWNHGNAHFLRGVVTELMLRGHSVRVYEPHAGWSLTHLLQQHGSRPLHEFRACYPHLASMPYDPATLDLDQALRGADVVLVHEWNDPELVARIGRHRRHRGRYVLLFHDTHHRAVTAPDELTAFGLDAFDGVLAYGRVLRDLYVARGWARRAWVWHEAADVRVFRPLRGVVTDDLVWIGNWGDGERSDELAEFLLAPVRALRLHASAYGVRYPEPALRALHQAGIRYRGWTPNFRAPHVYARAAATLHVPRRAYREQLPGIPTIRVFEALACGIPLISAPWPDREALFTPGRDFLVAEDRGGVVRHLQRLREDRAFRRELVRHGLQTIRARHTCAHRVTELLAICAVVAAGGTRAVTPRRRLAPAVARSHSR